MQSRLCTTLKTLYCIWKVLLVSHPQIARIGTPRQNAGRLSHHDHWPQPRLYLQQSFSCRAETKANVPQSFAFEVFEDRESIPKYMSWIQEVKNTGENTSSWMLRQDAFGRTWEVSWLALNLPPIPDQKIHWESVPGSTQGSGGIQVQNKGEVRFMQLSEKACKVRLAVQFEVPPPLLPFGPLLTPLVSGIIQSDMQEFARYAQRKYTLQQQRAQREAKA